mmetsp:Transcript_70377/g.122206  ORF Transcript_70377/g.122206 Transcript_70377/m.122206 type:complete len:153 (+) Transcript_70377:52-510(+)
MNTDPLISSADVEKGKPGKSTVHDVKLPRVGLCICRLLLSLVLLLAAALILYKPEAGPAMLLFLLAVSTSPLVPTWLCKPVMDATTQFWTTVFAEAIAQALQHPKLSKAITEAICTRLRDSNLYWAAAGGVAGTLNPLQWWEASEQDPESQA